MTVWDAAKFIADMTSLTQPPVPRLTITNADIGYAGSPVLISVNINVAPGEVLGLIGRNGSGKSTLLRAIIGEAEVLEGSICVSGNPVPTQVPTDKICRQCSVAYLPQTHRGIENLSVIENVELAAWDHGSRRGRRKIADSVLALDNFRALVDHRNRPAVVLSGGQRLLLSLAMMVAREADLYLLDEPSAGADEDSCNAAISVIRHMTSTGAGVLVVEQRKQFLLQVADRAVSTYPAKSEIVDKYSDYSDSLYTLDEFSRNVIASHSMLDAEIGTE